MKFRKNFHIEILVSLTCLSLLSYFAFGIAKNLSNLTISNWSLSELLINYEGGFVRRGLFGQVVYLTNDPIYFATLFQKIVLVLVFFGIVTIIFLEKSIISKVIFTTALIFAPGGMEDMKVGNVYEGGLFEYLDRKEIWFYLGIILFYFSTKYISNFPVLNSLIFATISSILILHHELFIIFSLATYSTLLISQKFKLKSRTFYGAIIFYFVTVSSFLLVYLNHGDQNTADKILNSYQIKFPGIEVNGGGIHAIAWTIGKSHELPLRLIAEGSVLYYVYFALFSIMLTLLFSIFKFKKLDQLGLAIFLNFLIFMGCLGITYVFWDIGRLISIYTITTLLSIEVLAAGLEKFEERSSLRFQSKSILLEKTKTNLLLGLILLYLVFINLITRVEHCCPQPAQIPLRSIFGIFN